MGMRGSLRPAEQVLMLSECRSLVVRMRRIEEALRSGGYTAEVSTLASSPVAPGPQATSPPAYKRMSSGVSYWRFDPEIIGRIAIRAAPDVNAERCEEFLMEPGTVFRVAEEVDGSDGVVYLRLADGRGW